ncbi:MAG: FHA domain-containing protein [Betaproteobacteria bacterium]
MKFEVSYRSGTTHQVDLAAVVAVLGRDPNCDIVLNDTKCSRRHATVEEEPEGLVIRDTGSANGTYVNGRRVEQARLRPGDTVRLGDVSLRLLADVGETVVVAPDDIELEPLGLSPAPAAERRPEGRRKAAEPRLDAALGTVKQATGPRPSSPAPLATRPLTVTLLSVLWALFVPTSVAAILYAASELGSGPLAWSAGAALAVIAAGFGVAQAVGLRSLAPWARHLQIAAAAVGLVACPFTLASATVLLYLSRPEVRATFEPRPGQPRPAGAGTAEPTFALSILVMLVLGVGLAAVALLLLHPVR